LNELTFIEMFSGIGGFRSGLERSGWKCVWANDNNKYANKIYKIHFGWNELDEGDIRKKGTDRIPEHTLLTAGFPCQAFSVAGKRKGFKDTRGTLFYEICRVAEAKKPTLLLLENVKGLLSHDKGLTFQVILESLDELGYWCEWQVLNSKYFGVPQNRERVFIVGHKTNSARKRNTKWSHSRKNSKRQGDKPNIPCKTQQDSESRFIFPIRQETAMCQICDIAGHLREGSTRQIFPIGEISKDSIKTQTKTRGERSRIRNAGSLGVGGSFKERNLIANTLSNRYYKNESENLLQIKGVTLANTSRYNQGVTRTPFKKDNQSWCLNEAGDQGVCINSNIRRLTPIECERLQGFPDNWTRWLSDTQRYKCLGNAVTVNIIEYLGEKLKNCLVN